MFEILREKMGRPIKNWIRYSETDVELSSNLDMLWQTCSIPERLLALKIPHLTILKVMKARVHRILLVL